MRMIATGLKVYGKQQLAEGDEFDAEEKDVHVLRIGQLAKPAPEQRDMDAGEPGEYLTRDMTARRGRNKRTSH